MEGAPSKLVRRKLEFPPTPNLWLLSVDSLLVMFLTRLQVSIDNGCCWTGTDQAELRARVLFANFPRRVDKITPNNVAINGQRGQTGRLRFSWKQLSRPQPWGLSIQTIALASPSVPGCTYTNSCNLGPVDCRE